MNIKELIQDRITKHRDKVNHRLRTGASGAKDWDGDAVSDSELYEIAADYIIELQKERDEARREAEKMRDYASGFAGTTKPEHAPRFSWEND